LSLRARFIAYLVVVHVLFAALAVYLLLQQPVWLIAVEAAFAVSLVTGVALVQRVFRALSFAGDSAQFLGDTDFTARFLEVGQPEVDRLIGVYNRMVDHLRAERQRVQEQHYFLSRILEVSPSGIVVLDFDGRIELVNPAAERLFDRPAAQMRHRLPGDVGVPLLEAVAAMASGESRVVGAPGGRRVRLQHGTFVDRGFGRSFFLLEELTEELRQSEKAAYEKLIRMMSHEVNNSVGASSSLLHSCLSYSHQLSEADRADFERALHIAIDRMGQLNRFMRSFADVVRLPPPAVQPVALVQVLDRIEGLMRAECLARSITWQRTVADGRTDVAADPVQLEQALVNIVKNAIEAIDRNGTITVRLAEENGRVRLEVEDTGPGIASGARDQLFTPFFTTKAHGQGIGLTMVAEILGNHRFDFALDGPPGGPTSFTIRF
jgi:nitrogen fixation/metabolism regulation signal transduction histidine kinase